MSVDGAGMNFGPTYGAMLVGNMVSTVLYGLVSMQIIMYLSTFFQEDNWPMTTIVFALWFLETAHVYFVGNYLYYNLVTNYCHPILTTTKLEDVTTIVIALITFIVHCFYTRRVWILSRKNWWITGMVGTLAVTHFAFEVTVMGLTYKFPQYDQLHIISPYFTTALALAAGLDILIAGTIVFLLNRQRTGIERTETILNKIVVTVIGSGALTSITDVVILICYLAMPNNLIYLGIYAFICDLYTISLFTSLGARESMRDTRTGVTSTFGWQSHSLATFPAAGELHRSTSSGKTIPPGVHLFRSTTVDSDK